VNWWSQWWWRRQQQQQETFLLTDRSAVNKKQQCVQFSQTLPHNILYYEEALEATVRTADDGTRCCFWEQQVERQNCWRPDIWNVRLEIIQSALQRSYCRGRAQAVQQLLGVVVQGTWVVAELLLAQVNMWCTKQASGLSTRWHYCCKHTLWLLGVDRMVRHFKSCLE
jgi:hypothetical protein